MNGKFDASRTLERLKDFQRRTVEYIDRRLFLDPSPARRFLVADEVGLGKTLVARGVIAKVIERLQDQVKRIDIIYVCSNAAIASQNIGRLNISSQPGFALASRLTLLPLHVHNLQGNAINFISFTPATTFDLRSRGGTQEERRLLYQMLREALGVNPRGLLRLLQATAGDGWFTYAKEAIEYDAGLAERYQESLWSEKASSLRTRLAELCDYFRDGCHTITDAINQQRLGLIGELRQHLARICLDALEPDLVILDEFQRFRDLLNPDEPTAELAQALFNWSDELKILLLSATPYKMYAGDLEDEDHHRDFLNTLRFLLSDSEVLASLKDNLQALRRGLLEARSEADFNQVEAVKTAVEAILRRVMCRTERVAATAGFDAMVMECREEADFRVTDLEDLALVDRVAQLLDSQDALEYWKSSPYLLNFMKDYQLKQKLKQQAQSNPDLARAVVSHQARLLKPQQMRRYQAIDAANPRLRLLVKEIHEQGLWRLLWLPPSLPYWQPAGPYAQLGDVSKTLVFSGWNVVPDALSALLSYEVERLMLSQAQKAVSYEGLDRQFAPRLRFRMDKENRYQGMLPLALLYPSPTLAASIDPLALALECKATDRPTLDDVRDRATQRLHECLQSILPAAELTGSGDRRWYWASVALLDAVHFPKAGNWCESNWSLAQDADEDSQTGFQAHVSHWRTAFVQRLDPPLGPPPDDLPRVLAELALAGPGTCALRALHRQAPELAWDNVALLTAASQIARGFRSQFNLPEVIALLSSTTLEDDAYWRQVLRYGLDGNLQAVLDEQVHVLKESLGLADATPERQVERIAQELQEALSIRAAQLQADDIQVSSGAERLELQEFKLRCRYALRFSDLHDGETVLARKEMVRVAFNSPFRPFVLASTSVGQEGLDFHLWCHAVMHWNLPSNPVDLEQREGRVHRYKGYAIRKNVARRFGHDGLHRQWQAGQDPWQALFQCALDERRPGENDLVPYWLYEVENGAKIKRRVPLIPYSRDTLHYGRLQQSLALYRMVFGQPRQEDLLTHLIQRFDAHEAQVIAEKWRIRLNPSEEGENA